MRCVDGHLGGDFIPGQPAAGRKTKFKFVSIPKWGRGGDNGPRIRTGHTTNPTKVFLDLYIFESGLLGIGDMLPATSTAVRGIAACGLDPVWIGDFEAFNDGFEMLLFLAEDFNRGDVAGGSARNQDGLAVRSMGNTNAPSTGAFHENTF